MITITAKVDGFRRAGMAHPASVTEHPGDAFTPEQLDALKSEPMLVVEEKPDAPKPGKKPGKTDDPKPDPSPKPDPKGEEKPGPEGGDPAPGQGA